MANLAGECSLLFFFITKILFCVFLFSYYIGRIPVFLVTDSEMLKQILVKQFDNFTDRFSVSDKV